MRGVGGPKPRQRIREATPRINPPDGGRPEPSPIDPRPPPRKADRKILGALIRVSAQTVEGAEFAGPPEWFDRAAQGEHAAQGLCLRDAFER